MAGMDDLLNDTPAEKALSDAIRTESTPPPEAIEPAPPEPAPALEPASEPEKAAEPEPAKPAVSRETEKPPARLVPIDSLHEERQRRQALERELAQLRQPPPQEEMDELKDPIGVIGQLKQEINQFKALERQKAEEADLGVKIATRVQSYAKENPDYPQQYLFLQASRVNELRELGYDDATIARQIRSEEMDLGRVALSQDKDPGELIAKLAAARGWRKQEAPAAAPAVAQAPQQGGESPEDRIDRLERGRRAAQSSSGSGGRGSNNDELSIEQIVNLEGAAFDKAAAAFIAREMRGGR